MAIRRAVLLIADIGGYTRYMNWNRAHLTHAQLTVAQLLESVIDAGRGLKLAKLEGDAAFFWAPDGNANVLVSERLSRMRQSFLARKERIAKDHSCECASCAQLDNLSLKAMRLRSKPLMHDFEGLGETSTHYIDLAGSEVLPVVVPERSSVGRLWLKVKLGSSSLPFLVGIKKPAEGFRNLGRGTEDQLAG